MHHPLKKTRIASLEQSQEPVIDSLKKAGRHFSLKRLSFPPEITLLYLHLSQKMGSVSSPKIHLPWPCKGWYLFSFPFLTLPNPSCDKTLQPITWPLCIITYISCTLLSRLGSNTLSPLLNLPYKLPIKPSIFVCYSLQPWGWMQQVHSNVSIHHYDYMASQPRRP